MKVLGIDPGLTLVNPTAVVLLDTDKDVLVLHAVSVLDVSTVWEDRFLGVIAFLDHHINGGAAVDLVAYEIPFCGPNPLVAVMLSHIGGAARTLAWLSGCPSVKVAPTQAKVALASKGSANKEQMITAALSRWGVTLTKDEADAAGVAVAGAQLWEAKHG
jgi:Holliday junction resolvasome RuvABC endonuclease subunit